MNKQNAQNITVLAFSMALVCIIGGFFTYQEIVTDEVVKSTFSTLIYVFGTILFLFLLLYVGYLFKTRARKAVLGSE